MTPAPCALAILGACGEDNPPLAMEYRGAEARVATSWVRGAGVILTTLDEIDRQIEGRIVEASDDAWLD